MASRVISPVLVSKYSQYFFFTTSDYLMNGASNEVISAQLTDKELLNQFKAVEKLSQEDRHLIKTFIDAFSPKDRFKN